MYSLLPITDEEHVARQILLANEPHTVIHMVDAKNLERMLPLSLQLLELDLHVVLVLNMMDEAKRLGIKIDVCRAVEASWNPGYRGSRHLQKRPFTDQQAILEQDTSPGIGMCAPAMTRKSRTR